MKITNNGVELTADEVKALVRSFADGNRDSESADLVTAMRLALIQDQVPMSAEDKLDNLRGALHESLRVLDRLKKLTAETDTIVLDLQRTMDYFEAYLSRRDKC